MIRTLFVAAASLSFTACAMNADIGADAAAAVGDMTPTQASAYVAMAASSDMFEIESSRLALQRSQNTDIQQFARMMIDHHTQTTQQLSAAARAAGVTVPMSMSPMHARLVTTLNAAGSGRAFDRVYATQQVLAHQQALALHGNYAVRGDTPALRQTAGAATPIVRGHLNTAQNLPR